MAPCPGCGENFTGRSLSTHFWRTTNPLCIQARRAAENPVISDSDEEQFGQHHASDFPAGGGQFQGDFFGDNYTAADFGYLSDSEDSVTESEYEDGFDPDLDDPVARDNEAAAQAQFGEGWEPPRVPIIGGDMNMEDGSASVHAPPSRETRTIAEDHFHQPPMVVKFPGSRAGEPISSQRAPSSEEQYGSALGKSENVYAPFTSKMDWEVRRWAKLRGSGSTAFTELLKIPGVSVFRQDNSQAQA
jgi:hypothetical protein